MQVKQSLFPNIPERISGLEDIAENLWWSWHPAARMLFKRLDRRAWKESLHNPDKMLREVPKEILESAASDPEYLREYDIVISRFRNDLELKGCRYLESITDPSIQPIAYFSAEYGLHHSMPLYAGGLGFLAGDIMKECSDVSVPLVAIGFMYPEGYFHQRIREDGWQEHTDQILDRDAASISRVLNANGEQVVVHYHLPLPQGRKTKGETEVIPIDTFGRAEGTRNPDLLTASRLCRC